VPKKESKERFSSMITITWRIRWMSRLRCVWRAARTPWWGEDPAQPAAARARASRERQAARLS
jgi:hypothetical protein